jgi:hypothetical protein
MRIPFFNKAKSTPMRTGAMLQPSRVQPAHAAVLRTMSRRMVRMYESAMSDNLNADFPVSITSANAEILTSVAGTRSRSRTIVRDNPYAAAIEREYQNNVCGPDPFQLEMKVGKWVAGQFVEEVETNRLVEDAWHEAGLKENCTVRRDISRLEMDICAISSVVRDGGILFREYPGFPKNNFRYAIDPIEVDRLDQYFNRPANGGLNGAADGILSRVIAHIGEREFLLDRLRVQHVSHATHLEIGDSLVRLQCVVCHAANFVRHDGTIRQALVPMVLDEKVGDG